MMRHETVRVFNALKSADYIMDIIPTYINKNVRIIQTRSLENIRIIQYINNINSIKYLHSFSELSFQVHTPYFLFKMNKNVMKNYFPYSWNSFIYLYNINSRNLMKESSCKIAKFVREMHVFYHESVAYSYIPFTFL